MSPQTAEMLPSCSGGLVCMGCRRGCTHQSQDLVTEKLPLPQCQTIAWHFPAPGRNMQERWHHTDHTEVLLLESKSGRDLGRTPFRFLSQDWFIFQHLSLRHMFFCSGPHGAGKFLLCLTLVKVKALQLWSPGDPTNDTLCCCPEKAEETGRVGMVGKGLA